jgi:CheY-like chemotaxis protein
VRRSGSGRAKVLLVDAQQDTAGALATALRNAGYEVAIAATGSLAIAMLEWECPEAVISRAKVDDMDGFELFTRLRSDPTMSDTPFVLLAGRDRPCALAATEAGVDAVLTGDLVIDGIVTRVAAVLGASGTPAAPAPIRRPEPASRPAAEPLWTALERARTSPPAEVPSFQGSLGVIDLAEVTQAIALGGKTGCLVVTLSAGEGTMLFDAGRLVHATFGDRSGEDAFSSLISRSQREARASFRFNQADRHQFAHLPRSISRSVDQLLLSIAAGIDEAGGGAGHAPAALTRNEEGPLHGQRSAR